MHYEIELIDRAGLRHALLREVPLLEVRLNGPDEDDTIAGLLPPHVAHCVPGWTLRVSFEGRPIAEAQIERVLPHWGDSKKLILDRYVSFQHLLEVQARSDKSRFDPRLAHAYVNARIDDIARDLINRAIGPVHYTVAHAAYPEGAEREFAKFTDRLNSGNELEIGGIASGQWVGAGRIDATNAYAKDGDTIAGLTVDGIDWPDLRLMMIDAEETSLNSHAIKRHPEIAGWDSARYAASGYALQGIAAKEFLQDLLDTRGIDFIELNPHTNHEGAFDDRVDAYGRYLGLVYGAGQCFNAAMVESGHAAVYLHDEGRGLVPELALKEFFSYAGWHDESIDACATVLQSFDADAGLLALLASLAYAAPGMRLKLGREGALVLRHTVLPDLVLRHDPLSSAVAFGAEDTEMANLIVFRGNPLRGAAAAIHGRPDSRDCYGDCASSLTHFAFSTAADTQKLVEGLLDDLAYPATTGTLECFAGRADLAPGDLVELRGADLRRITPRLEDEHGGRFPERFVASVAAVRHRFMGRRVKTRCELGPPLRSVRDPLRFLLRGQRNEEALYEFRLDDVMTGVDAGVHLD